MSKEKVLVGREVAILRRRRLIGGDYGEWEVKELATIKRATLSNVYAGGYMFCRQTWQMRDGNSPNSGINSLARLSWDAGDIEKARTIQEQRKAEQTEAQRKAQDKADWLQQPRPNLAHRIVGRINTSDSDTCVSQLAALSEEVLTQVAEVLKA